MTKAKLYTKYPISSLLIYNGTTILHFLLGGAGIIVGYRFSLVSILFGYLYFAFSFLEMYAAKGLSKLCLLQAGKFPVRIRPERCGENIGQGRKAG
jgi:hypothetical protein